MSEPKRFMDGEPQRILASLRPLIEQEEALSAALTREDIRAAHERILSGEWEPASWMDEDIIECTDYQEVTNERRGTEQLALPPPR